MQEQDEVESLLQEMAEKIGQKLGDSSMDDALMIGIHTGGVWIAQRLHAMLHFTQALGTLDISFYRDDFSRIGINPQVKPSNLPVSVDDKNIFLVDDILHTGRTIRAALNEIFDYGRPASVSLVVLGERTGRELPIQADIVGKHLDLSAHEHVKLSGPDNLQLTLTETL